jgi:enamine deaminase RidA (YjgF/YER057c/UK114 family)
MRGTALLVAGLLALPAHAGARQDATVLLSESPRARAAQERYGYAEAVIAGDTIYLSGVVVGRAPDDADLAAAYTRAFRQIGATLARAGATLDDVVDITSFHTDVVPQVEAMAQAKSALFAAPPPAWTAIGATRLLPDGGITEIKVVARRSARAAAR